MAVGAPAGNSVHTWEWRRNGDAFEWVALGGTVTGPGVPFGTDVALSGDGNRMIVGAPSGGSGVVQVYQWDATLAEWRHIGDPVSGPQVGEGKGESVAMDVRRSRGLGQSSECRTL